MFKKLYFSLLLLATATAAIAGLNQVPGPVYGSQTGTAAAVGFVGETPAATVVNGISLTTTTAFDGASRSLAAGNWLVWCGEQFVPAGTTTVTAVTASVTTTSGVLGAYTNTATGWFNGVTGASTGNIAVNTPPVVFHFASPTTVICEGFAAFGTSTMSFNSTLTAIRF